MRTDVTATPAAEHRLHTMRIIATRAKRKLTLAQQRFIVDKLGERRYGVFDNEEGVYLKLNTGKWRAHALASFCEMGRLHAETDCYGGWW